MSDVTNELVQRLQRRHLAQLTPYASARRSMTGGSIWLNANEAPYTPSASSENLNRYPDFQNPALLQGYADYADVEANQVIACRGSDEAIDLLIRSFCEPGQDGILICPPTYGMYAISAQTHGAEVVQIPLVDTDAGALQLDEAAIIAALPGTKLIFLCNPSNPLGNELERAAIERILAATREQCLVVVDEAYIEYIGAASVIDLLANNPHLVILRTLSKAFGLAALRCGFALANPAVIEVLRKVIAPYPLPQPVVDKAVRALTEPALADMKILVQQSLVLREQLIDWLARCDWVNYVYPSVTNFVLVQVDDAEQRVRQFQQAGILVRNQSSQLGLNQVIRISIGSATELAAVKEVLEA
ncbi:histidinol-phosphate transaminase [Pseudidiomarina taiwanensis]|uniref:Histidinol-phosphate aminotransferase n=1 Tax=Pseudidiomarina taiwanensis TaxID=337250 RepID=A0A432ZNZ8_9GAMM|nr:histidinol-phosphate transaminase [Pseudidiomarina taiwanensis]RUO79581.1 histidinol-phosphate transaminase [Pseudidiomarina taiwanensis]